MVVDDVIIFYQTIEDSTHLHNAVNSLYNTTFDADGALYCNMTLIWDYTNWYVDILMPGYVEYVLAQFEVNMPTPPTLTVRTHSA